MKTKESKLSKVIRTLSIGWDYITIFTLITFGVALLSTKESIPYAIIVFSFALLFLILTTWKYIVGPRLKRDSKKKTNKKKLLAFLYTLVKFFIILLPLLSFNNNWTVNLEHPTLIKALSLTFLALSVIVQVVIFILKKTIGKIAEEIKKDDK
ncbi:MAG: hypothetical protein K6E21_03635 [Bacilli bacterium]|nr:hypothetical protein [Bacilli bacterium]